MSRIVVVDDDLAICQALEEALQTAGHIVAVYTSPEKALEEIQQLQPDIVVTDLRMQQLDGLAFLDAVRRKCPETPVALMSAQGTVDSVVTAFKKGAQEFLTKPFSLSEFDDAILRLMKKREASRSIETLKLIDDFQTQNPTMKRVLAEAARVACSEASILISGESGTGKTFLARLIHNYSRRAEFPFVDVSCATLSENLLESELFGHEKGAFTGAVVGKAGRLEIADRGTVFLDEIGDVPLAVQTKLLRFVQERAFERVGGVRTFTVDVRVISASNKDLYQAANEGKFRRDLLYRLNVLELSMPPLRERKEDIIRLAENFLRESIARLRRAECVIHEETKQILLEYPWHGNIRELKNVIERAAILADTEITPAELPERLTRNTATTTSVPATLLSLDELERQYIEEVLGRTKTLEEAAKILGIDTSTLSKKRKLYAAESRAAAQASPRL